MLEWARRREGERERAIEAKRGELVKKERAGQTSRNRG